MEIPITNILQETTRFVCVDECTACCVNKIVHLLPVDLLRLSKVVNIWDFVRFIEGHDEDSKPVKGEGMTGIMTIQHQEDGKCYFLNDEGKCSVYDNRPLVCQLYPINPLFIESEEKGKQISVISVDNEGCIGLGQGELLDHDLQKKLSEEWRRERLKYDKYIDKWNANPRGDLIQFIKEFYP
jgi:Fe-S-cluster containining protein